MTIPRAATVLVAYALLMLAGGVAAYFLAPPHANAVTALAVPSAVAALVFVLAGLALYAPRHRAIGMLGIRMGMVLALLVGAALASRAFSGMQVVSTHRGTQAEWDAYIEAGPDTGDDTYAGEPRMDREAFFAERDASPDDTTYLVVILWTLSALSFATFLTLLIGRPRVEQQRVDEELERRDEPTPGV